MMNFQSGGVQSGTLSAAPPPPAPAPEGPPRPAGIPEHYVFDNEVELWMPPSAISKAAAVAGTSSSASGITVIRPGGYTPAPYQASSNDPICHEFVNTGACGRLSRGEVCRYRHLDANHPDVIADKVRQGKLPPSAIAGGLAPGAGFAAGAAPGVDPTTGLSDPGPQAQLCFDFINNGQCSRLVSGQGCRYRHLPPTHPDVIADRIRTGKMNPAMAGAALAGTGLGGADASVQAAVLMATRGATMAPSIGVSGGGAVADGAFAQAALAMPDPGPGVQLCFDFINRGMCSRLVRGENCRYRHLAANHPDVIADKIRQGKAPGSLPTAPMGSYVENLAQMGAAMHGTVNQQTTGFSGGSGAAAAAALAVAAAAAVVLAKPVAVPPPLAAAALRARLLRPPRPLRPPLPAAPLRQVRARLRPAARRLLRPAARRPPRRLLRSAARRPLR